MVYHVYCVCILLHLHFTGKDLYRRICKKRSGSGDICSEPSKTKPVKNGNEAPTKPKTKQNDDKVSSNDVTKKPKPKVTRRPTPTRRPIMTLFPIKQ